MGETKMIIGMMMGVVLTLSIWAIYAAFNINFGMGVLASLILVIYNAVFCSWGLEIIKSYT